ncbi:MAG: hypothetical protein CYPHOPRED_006071 [Cyphobasidiales sp. Tagirdzhanova-0007]|nr:MAG: hypothetical protein CYPHOPRED_006071 [Cyphobasidiales sp. Tagirdzhanova-0007]
MTTFREPRAPLGKITTVLACGGALFSDGYVNAASGPARYILKAAYPHSYTARYGTLFSSLVFVGIIIGQATFGYIVDRKGRRGSMIFASIWLASLSLLSGLAYGGNNPKHLWKLLIAYRFFLGFGIGAEYPAGTVAAAENTEDPGISKNMQQKLLVLATNTMIDWGFVVAYLVPYICLHIFGEGNLEWVWRLTLGFGAIVPLVVLPFRLLMQEPKLYQDSAAQKLPTMQLPWGLIFKKYWPRLLGVSLSWFIYDWISYPAGIYSSVITGDIIPNGSISQNLGWDIVINAFYLPGTIIGAFFVDWLGPKYCMITGFMCQAIIGFAMSGAFDTLKNHIAGFAVLYGIYLSFGEFGPGNNLQALFAL